MATNQKFSILEPLAKELGYKDVKEMRDALGKEEAGRPGVRGAGFGNIGGAGGVGTGFLGGREVGSGLGVGVKSRLAKGISLKESITGGFKDFAQSFSKENIKRRTLEKTFGGPGLVSTFARGKLKQKYGTSPVKTEVTGAGESVGSLDTSDASLKIIAKESLVLPNIARDVNVMRQNLQKLVKLFGGKAATKRETEKKDESKTIDKDSSTSPTPIKQEGEVERAKDISYFAEQDKKEAELEAERKKDKTVVAAAPTPEKKEGEGGFLDSIMSLFADGFMQGIKKLFSPKLLGQVLKKVFLPIAIIGTLFSGITDGFKKYQETGSFGEAIIAGLGGMLKFLTFGLFGEDTLKSMWEAVSGFLEPITKTISGIFTGIKDFFKKIFGMGGEEDKGKDKIPKVTPQQPDPSKFALDAAKAGGVSDEKAADIGGLFGAIQSGDMKGLFGKAQELAAKYPSQAPAEGSPTPMSSEGVPLDQAQRNYELNKKLTGEASKALGTPLEFNIPAPKAATPTPAPMESFSKPPTPAPASGEDPEISALEGKIIDLETDIRNGKKMIERRKKHMSNPNISAEAKQTYAQANEASAQGVAENEAELEQVKKQLAEKKKAKGESKASAAPATAATPAAGAGAGDGEGSAGGGGGSGGSVSAGAAGGGSVSAGSESTPSMDMAAAPSTYGSDVGSTSAQIAEGQRMESAADQGSTINAPTTNNQLASDKTKSIVADVYNSDFVKMLATT